MQRVVEVYANCRSYVDSGTVTAKCLSADGKEVDGGAEAARSFSTVFVRPNRFRFEFQGFRDGKAWRYLIWANGHEVATAWDLNPRQGKPESLDSALFVATGVTEGSSTEIPGLLRPRRRAPAEPPEWKRLADEAVEGVSCFRVQSRIRAVNLEDRSPFEVVRTYWVEKKTFLVRRVQVRVEVAKDLRVETTTVLTPSLNQEVPAHRLQFGAPE
jgi:hypothetical protein